MPGFGIAAFALVLLVGVGGGLLLYGAVRAERGQRRPMDRESAEKIARRDTRESAERVARRDTDESPVNRGWGEQGRRDRDEGSRRGRDEGSRRDRWN